jgi:hypothetical protein
VSCQAPCHPLARLPATFQQCCRLRQQLCVWGCVACRDKILTKWFEDCTHTVDLLQLLGECWDTEATASWHTHTVWPCSACSWPFHAALHTRLLLPHPGPCGFSHSLTIPLLPALPCLCS